MLYHWQHPGWPEFTYAVDEIQPLILVFAQETGVMNGN